MWKFSNKKEIFTISLTFLEEAFINYLKQNCCEVNYAF